MSRRKSSGLPPRKRYKPLPVTDYIRHAKELAQFAPSLKKYKNRKTLKPSEKSAIRAKMNALKYTDRLVKVPVKQMRALKDYLVAPGVNAVKLNDTGADAKIVKVDKDHLAVRSNGRIWLYWRLDAMQPKNWRRSLKKAAETAFITPDAFPIEKIQMLAERAFANIKTIQVALWAKSGRVGEVFRDIGSFMDWLTDTYTLAYKDTDEWMNGLAVLVEG